MATTTTLHSNRSVPPRPGHSGRVTHRVRRRCVVDTYSHTHAYSHTLTRMLSHTHHTHSRKQTHSHTHQHTNHVHAHTHSHTNTNTNAHANTHTHTHTHMHTQRWITRTQRTTNEHTPMSASPHASSFYVHSHPWRLNTHLRWLSRGTQRHTQGRDV